MVLDVRGSVRLAIQRALKTIDAPINVIIDAVILPYAIDRRTMLDYYRDASEACDDQIRQITATKELTTVLQTMVRYPSFVSDAWIDAVRIGRPDGFRYSSIEYSSIVRSYAYFFVRINNGDLISFLNCPSSAEFSISNQNHGYPQTIETYIQQRIGTGRPSTVLNDFARTGRFDVADLRGTMLVDNCLQILPVVHAYFRLTELVRRGICPQTTRCNVCGSKPVTMAVPVPRPFPAELYDDDF